MSYKSCFYKSVRQNLGTKYLFLSRLINMDIFVMAGILFTEGMLSLSYHEGISLCFLNSETKEQNSAIQIHPCVALSYQVLGRSLLNGRRPCQNCPQEPGDNNHENWFPLPHFYIGCLPSKNTWCPCASQEIFTTSTVPEHH